MIAGVDEPFGIRAWSVVGESVSCTRPSQVQTTPECSRREIDTTPVDYELAPMEEDQG